MRPLSLERRFTLDVRIIRIIRIIAQEGGPNRVTRHADRAVTLLVIVCGLAAAHAQSKPDTSAGAKTFSRICAACHGSDGRGGERAPDIATNRVITTRTVTDLEADVKNGVPGKGMPAFAYLGPQGVSDVVAYLRVLQGKDVVVTIAGDPAAGKMLFEGKAGCARCHMVKGSGGFLGPDLSAYASGIAPEEIHLAITEPDRRLQPTYAVVDLVLGNGTALSGTVRAEDNFTLTIQTDTGAFRTFQKAALKSIRHTTHSVMPKDYGTRLTAKELEDIASYLLVAASDAPPKPARRRRQ
jgi:putative heme-binding domain-containing protein